MTEPLTPEEREAYAADLRSLDAVMPAILGDGSRTTTIDVRQLDRMHRAARTDTRPCTEGPDGGTCDGTDHVRHLVWSCFTATELGRLRDVEGLDFLDGARLEYREGLEARRLLGYLWMSSGTDPDVLVADLFRADDPIVEDVMRLAIFPKEPTE